MNTETIITSLAMIPAVLAAFMLYIWLLMYVARIFTGFVKNIIASLIYGVFGVAVVSPLFYLIRINQEELMKGNNSLLAIVLGCYAIVVIPGFCYLFSKIGVLRAAGYFKPRS